MNLKSDDTTIDGIGLSCTQFAATQAFTLFGRLVKVLGPAMTVLGAAKADADIMTVLPGALRDVEPVELTALARDMLANTTATSGGAVLLLNNQTAFDAVFSGKLVTMVRAFAFAVKVNFADFFAEAAKGGLAEAAPASV